MPLKIQKSLPMNPLHFKFILVVSMILCLAATGIAIEQWDAETSARVNLRKKPDLSGQILDTIPIGHKVRMLQRKGLWWKVEVGGQNNGRGWVYARYLERLKPEAMKSKPTTRSVGRDSGSEDHKQKSPPAEPVPGYRSEEKAMEPSEMLQPAVALTSRGRDQAAAQQDLSGAKNETMARTSMATLMNARPVRVRPDRKPYYRFKEEMSEISGKVLSGTDEEDIPATVRKTLPGEKKIHDEAGRKTVPAVSKHPLPKPPVLVPPVIKSSVYPDTKGPALKQRTIGPFALALKLVSIVLYGIIILLLYQRGRE
jgi:uncharacterized protein YgiM (DUF1202 family)